MILFSKHGVFLAKSSSMHPVSFYRNAFDTFWKTKIKDDEPERLYQPMTYIMGLGGKRLRPTFTLLTAEIFGGHYEDGLDAALAIEVFHNFSLVHDDIMDDAPLRRGKVTVHEKWDINTGILSGDAMLINSYRFLEKYKDGIFRDLVSLFSTTAKEVCEGQQYDMDFETRKEVSVEEYLKMITYKTAVLIAAAMKMGAIVAGAPITQQDEIYAYGKNLGIAFQLQDDFLDAFGDPEKFGKQIGGDIIENKKTFLYLKALEAASPVLREELENWFSSRPDNSDLKVQRVKEIYEETGAAALSQQEIGKYTLMAGGIMDKLQVPEDRKIILRQLGDELMNRVT